MQLSSQTIQINLMTVILEWCDYQTWTKFATSSIIDGQTKDVSEPEVILVILKYCSW